MNHWTIEFKWSQETDLLISPLVLNSLLFSFRSFLSTIFLYFHTTFSHHLLDKRRRKHERKVLQIIPALFFKGFKETTYKKIFVFHLFSYNWLFPPTKGFNVLWKFFFLYSLHHFMTSWKFQTNEVKNFPFFIIHK